MGTIIFKYKAYVNFELKIKNGKCYEKVKVIILMTRRAMDSRALIYYKFHALFYYCPNSLLGFFREWVLLSSNLIGRLLGMHRTFI